MTEEELEREAEEKAKKRTKGFKCQDNCEKSYVMGALDFAEPREKRIAELEKVCNKNMELADEIDKLEKENREQKKQIEWLDMAINSDIPIADKLEELEKENAELKDKLEHRNCVDCSNHGSNIKLFKAKKIIKTFLGFAEAFGYSPSMDKFITEAEQFIKDSEVKK